MSGPTRKFLKWWSEYYKTNWPDENAYPGKVTFGLVVWRLRKRFRAEGREAEYNEAERKYNKEG